MFYETFSYFSHKFNIRKKKTTARNENHLQHKKEQSFLVKNEKTSSLRCKM